MKKNLLLLLFVLISVSTYAQTFQWSATNLPTSSYRYEDVYFLNPDTGFAVHYYDIPFGGEYGYIIRTVNAGATWTKVVDSTIFQFRSVGFTDALHGWVGTFEQSGIDADTNIIYKTLDGGLTWSGVENFPGPDSAGICGIRVINNTTLYCIGRYSDHPGFYKTTDNGANWSYTNLDQYLSGVVDISFFNADTGFVVGTTGPLYYSGYGRVLYTTDAGNTWSIVHTSSRLHSLGWKITFPSRNIGYCSLQSFNGAVNQHFLKTTDGGLTWLDIPYSNGGPSDGYNIEGMGFINDTVGWVGGSTFTFFTNDGGVNWTPELWGNNLNRFRFFSDTLAYSAGDNIYKLHITPTGINEINNNAHLSSYPNPTNDNAYFEFFVYKATRVKLSVFDLKGKEMDIVFDRQFNYGNQHFLWQPKNLTAGIYICKLEMDNNVLSKKIEIVK